MKRRSGMMARVKLAHEKNPTWGATRIAHELGVTDAYVRATAARLGVRLPRSKPGQVPTHGQRYMAAKRAA